VSLSGPYVDEPRSSDGRVGSSVPVILHLVYDKEGEREAASPMSYGVQANGKLKSEFYFGDHYFIETNPRAANLRENSRQILTPSLIIAHVMLDNSRWKNRDSIEFDQVTAPDGQKYHPDEDWIVNHIEKPYAKQRGFVSRRHYADYLGKSVPVSSPTEVPISDSRESNVSTPRPLKERRGLNTSNFKRSETSRA
jgi:hypothetical protein